MGTSSKPSRIILAYKGRNYKLLNFFIDRRDNSFYFHIYRKPGETPMKCIDGEQQRQCFPIHFPSLKPTGFPENKISFHQSGYIHSTDGKGQRYRDGTVGIPFKDVVTFMFFLVVAPKHPEDMAGLGTVDKSRDIHIALSDDAGPFAVQFAVVRKGTKELPLIPPEQDLLGNCIMCKYDDKEFDLLIAATKVMNSPDMKTPELNRAAWPPFHLVLKRVG